jgi:hypothetical protein
MIQIPYTPTNTSFPINPNTHISAPSFPDYSQQQYNNNNIPFAEATPVNDGNLPCQPSYNPQVAKQDNSSSSSNEPGTRKLMVVCPPGVEAGMMQYLSMYLSI